MDNQRVRITEAIRDKANSGYATLPKSDMGEFYTFVGGVLAFHPGGWRDVPIFIARAPGGSIEIEALAAEVTP